MARDGTAELKAERARLFERFAADRSEANRNALVESYVPLAEFFAKRYRDRGVESEDLRQVAKVALVKAVDRFDPCREVQFSTFAGRTIDGELKRYFRDKTWAVRVPRSLQESSLDVRRASDELSVQLGRPPTVEQLADATGYDVDQVIEALDVQSSYRATSIEGATNDADSPGTALRDRIESREDRIEESEQRMTLERLLGTLPDRERRILELRFFDELSQTEIAERVGVSQMHVSRLIRRSLESLRAQLPADRS